MPGQPDFGEAPSQGNLYAQYDPFATFRDRPGSPNIYSVWRLDAANANLARGLVDKAVTAEANGLSGRACFDRRYGAIARVGDFNYGAGDWDIYRAAEFARKSGFQVIEDENEQEFGLARELGSSINVPIACTV